MSARASWPAKWPKTLLFTALSRFPTRHVFCGFGPVRIPAETAPRSFRAGERSFKKAKMRSRNNTWRKRVPPLELHVLALLRARNRAAAPALAVTKAATTLLTECTALEKQLDRERQATDLLVKERHEMVADMELLRQNEANGGVSREHIEQLRDLLEKSKTEAARSASEAAAARASDTSTSEAAQLMAGKLVELRRERRTSSTASRSQLRATRAWSRRMRVSSSG